MATNDVGGTSGQVERKTLFATLAAYAAPFVALGLANWLGDANLADSVPDWAETVFGPLIPAVATFLTAYYTKHKPGAMSRSARRALNR